MCVSLKLFLELQGNHVEWSGAVHHLGGVRRAKFKVLQQCKMREGLVNRACS